MSCEATFETIVGDTAKPLEAVLGDEEGPVRLLGATCRLHMAPEPESGRTTPTVNAAATIVNPNAAVGEAGCGLVRYFFAEPDVAVAGLYRAQFKVTFGDGSKLTFPDGEYIEVTIRRGVLPQS
jgi:hypothetical protein